MIARDGCGRRKGGDEVRIAALKIPEVMQVAVGKDDEPAVLRFGVFACLLFTDQWIFVFGFGFEDDEGGAFLVQQQEIDEASARIFEVHAEFVDGLGCECDLGLKLNAGGAAIIGKEAPARRRKQLVNFDAGGGFFGRHGV